MNPSTPQPPVLAEISADGDRVNVTFPYNPSFVVKIKNVPTRRFVPKDKGGPLWRLNLDLTTMRRLREQFGEDLRLGEKLIEWGHDQVSKERNLSDLSQADDADLEHLPAKLVKGCKVDGESFKLRPYQKADIKFMATTKRAIIANQPRTGKTITVIGTVFEAQLEEGQHLIFAPVSSLRNVWEDEINHAYRCAGFDAPTVLTGDTPDERREAIAEAKRLSDEGLPFWLVLNPAMARLKRQKVEGTSGDSIEYEEVLSAPQLAEIDWDSMTIDEFHLMGLSNPTTLGARGVNEIAETTQPELRLAMSGTPMGGKPVKLWGALRFCNPEEFTSRWNWARQWLVVNHNGYGHQIEGIMPGREVDFYNHLKPYLVRRTQKEALPGLPPVNRVNVWCPMTERQHEQYLTFATEAEWRIDDAIEEHGEGRLTAMNILSEYARLKQFADAYCDVKRTGKESAAGVAELKVHQTRDSGKLEQLIEKLREENVITSKGEDEEEPRSAVIFSQFNAMVAMVADYLREEHGITTGVIDGSVTGKKRDEMVRAFQAGEIQVLVMNTKAGGAAITLNRADNVHILDETWVPDDQEQAENRVTPTTKELMEARPSTGVYYYRTRETIEEKIQKLVADKALNNRTILDLRRRMQKALEEAERDEAGE